MARAYIYRGLAIGGVLLLGFQNCAKTGIAVSDATLASQSNGDPTFPTPEPTPASTPVIPTGTPSGSESSTLSLNPVGDYICSPFGGGASSSVQSGLKAELRYMVSNASTDSKNGVSSAAYFDSSRTDIVTVANPIYLNDVNVPTRAYTSGFETSGNALVQDNNGNPLIEYFALRMDSLLKLGPNDAEGIYELSTVADDGSLIQLQDKNGNWVTVVDNDGNHSARMGCGNGTASVALSTDATPTAKIAMTKSSLIPIRIYYNQGPRELIANVLFWNYRGASASATPAVQDSVIHKYCGKSDNAAFWNWNSKTSTSDVGANVTDMVNNEKWKIIAPVNFQLPDNQVNPCSYAQVDIIQSMDYSFEASGALDLALTLKVDAKGQVNLYVLDAQGNRTLLNSVTLSDTKSLQNFSFPPLDATKDYKVELILNVPSQNITVHKEYDLKSN